MVNEWRLRPLQSTDCEAVRAIFNDYVADSFAAYAEIPLSLAQVHALLATIQGYPALAAENERGELIGFAFLRPYSPYRTFARTALETTFIAVGATGKGLGSAFLTQLESSAREKGISRLLAHISSKNDASVAFHQKHGFVQCGCFHDIGRKHGQSFDVVWFEKFLLPAEEE